MRIKHHINLAFPMDNSMQKKAWNILTDSPPVSRTSAICHALCEYRQQWAFLRAIQQLLDDTEQSSMIEWVMLLLAILSLSGRDSMTIKEMAGTHPEHTKTIFAEECWLKYYNQVLLDCGLITAQEHHQMIHQINARTARHLS